jgi:hypothetical protein
MLDLLFPSFDAMAFSAVVCVALRQGMIVFLPDHIAGPGGWLIDTGTDTDRTEP